MNQNYCLQYQILVHILYSKSAIAYCLHDVIHNCVLTSFFPRDYNKNIIKYWVTKSVAFNRLFDKKRERKENQSSINPISLEDLSKASQVLQKTVDFFVKTTEKYNSIVIQKKGKKFCLLFVLLTQIIRVQGLLSPLSSRLD